jgi:hypothetical protein
LQGYDDEVVMAFALNFGVEQSMAAGTQVEVTKETMAEATSFQCTSERWYSRRTSKPKIL